MSEPIKIEYSRPHFYERIFADFLDGLIFILLFLLLFIGTRNVISSSSQYQNKLQRINEIRINSGLYVLVGGQTEDVITYYSSQDNLSASERKNDYISAINKFIQYVKDNCTDANLKTTVEESYYSFRINESLAYNGVTYFTLNSLGNIIENPSCKATQQEYADNCYGKFIDDYCQGYMGSLFPEYVNNTKYLSNMLFFVEIPISYIVGAILAFFVPPLFFVRGRKTIGKAVYHIGRVDASCLNVSIGRYSAETAIFIFGIIVLSLLTFGIPLIISFSMMAFSKNKQDFPDYMLGIEEVSTKNAKIYKSKDEILFEKISNTKDPIDFKMDTQDK